MLIDSAVVTYRNQCFKHQWLQYLKIVLQSLVNAFISHLEEITVASQSSGHTSNSRRQSLSESRSPCIIYSHKLGDTDEKPPNCLLSFLTKLSRKQGMKIRLQWTIEMDVWSIFPQTLITVLIALSTVLIICSVRV